MAGEWRQKGQVPVLVLLPILVVGYTEPGQGEKAVPVPILFSILFELELLPFMFTGLRAQNINSWQLSEYHSSLGLSMVCSKARGKAGAVSKVVSRHGRWMEDAHNATNVHTCSHSPSLDTLPYFQVTHSPNSRLGQFSIDNHTHCHFLPDCLHAESFISRGERCWPTLPRKIHK